MGSPAEGGAVCLNRAITRLLPGLKTSYRPSLRRSSRGSVICYSESQQLCAGAWFGNTYVICFPQNNPYVLPNGQQKHTKTLKPQGHSSIVFKHRKRLVVNNPHNFSNWNLMSQSNSKTQAGNQFQISGTLNPVLKQFITRQETVAFALVLSGLGLAKR